MNYEETNDLTHRFTNIKTYFKYVDMWPELVKHTDPIYVSGENMEMLIKKHVSPILVERNISKESIDDFVSSLNKNLNREDVLNIINLIENPPYDLLLNLNRVINISDLKPYIKLSDNIIRWLGRHKFLNGATVGVFEAFLIILFRRMDNPTIGDVRYNHKDIIEVKGTDGRLTGHFGYNKGSEFVQEILLKLGYKLPEDKIDYNIKDGNKGVNGIQIKINAAQTALLESEKKYIQLLEEKKERMLKFSNKKHTQEYRNKKLAYEKHKREPYNPIKKLKLKIMSLEQLKKKCILENISIDLAKKSLDDSIIFLSDIFKRKYINANIFKIELFVKSILNNDGSFTRKFRQEYLIFEFDYYKSIEGFKYFCLANLKKQTLLMVDSVEKFRQFVYSGNIIPRNIPSFSDRSDSRGAVFQLYLEA